MRGTWAASFVCFLMTLATAAYPAQAVDDEGDETWTFQRDGIWCSDLTDALVHTPGCTVDISAIIIADSTNDCLPAGCAVTFASSATARDEEWSTGAGGFAQRAAFGFSTLFVPIVVEEEIFSKTCDADQSKAPAFGIVLSDTLGQIECQNAAQHFVGLEAGACIEVTFGAFARNENHRSRTTWQELRISLCRQENGVLSAGSAEDPVALAPAPFRTTFNDIAGNGSACETLVDNTPDLESLRGPDKCLLRFLGEATADPADCIQSGCIISLAGVANARRALTFPIHGVTGVQVHDNTNGEWLCIADAPSLAGANEGITGSARELACAFRADVFVPAAHGGCDIVEVDVNMWANDDEGVQFSPVSLTRVFEVCRDFAGQINGFTSSGGL